MSRAGFAAAFFLAAVAFGAAQAPQQTSSPFKGCPPPPPGRGGGGMLAGAGPSDKPFVDAAAADRGRKTWASECIDCHGTQARGTDNGPNLIRSVVVLHDRCGTTLGPFLQQGHKTQSGRPSASLGTQQVEELSHFLRQRVNDSLRGSPIFQVQNVLTGDAGAGEAFFNGEGKCATCHSPTGNLAGIGSRYEPVDIQQRFLFPGTGRGGRGRGAAAANATAVTVTVTPEGGTPINGVLVQMDDFYVSLRTKDGAYQTVRRDRRTKVEKTDPLAFHVALLDRLTDKNMHDVVAYLEKLK